MNKNLVVTIGYYLGVIGALNWGLVGIGYFLSWNLNLVDLILGNWPLLENLVYVLVGIGGVLILTSGNSKKSSVSSSSQPMSSQM